MSRNKTKNVAPDTDEPISIETTTIVEDKTDVYKKEIKDKIASLRQICLVNNIPFFCVFGTQLKSDGKFNKETDAMLPEQFYANGESSDTAFADMVNIMNGFTTVYQPEKEMIDTDEFGLSDDVMTMFMEED